MKLIKARVVTYVHFFVKMRKYFLTLDSIIFYLFYSNIYMENHIERLFTDFKFLFE